MNSETVQGYGIKNEKEEQKEREYQAIVSKGIELLNTHQTNTLIIIVKNRWIDIKVSKELIVNKIYVKLLNCGLYGVLSDEKNLNTSDEDGNTNVNVSGHGTYDWNIYKFIDLNCDDRSLFLCDIGNDNIASKIGFFIIHDGG